jgi:hypothetical protein
MQNPLTLMKMFLRFKEFCFKAGKKMPAFKISYLPVEISEVAKFARSEIQKDKVNPTNN